MAAVAPILQVDPQHPASRTVHRAVAALREGGLIAYPTDTYYGIGCDLFLKGAMARLFALKGPNRKRPLTLICPDLSDVAKYARVSNFAYRTMRHLTPGPFTFVLEATRLVPEVMMIRQKQVGIRVPESPIALALSRELGHPLANTSATPSDDTPLTDARDIKAALGHGLSLILDGGPQVSEPSTVVSLLGDEIGILRAGKGEIPETWTRGQSAE